jgi:hypothetical protein
MFARGTLKGTKRFTVDANGKNLMESNKGLVLRRAGHPIKVLNRKHITVTHSLIV